MAAKDNIFTLEGQQKSGLLAPEMVGEIFKKVQESSVVAPMCGTVPMGANGSEYVIRHYSRKNVGCYSPPGGLRDFVW